MTSSLDYCASYSDNWQTCLIGIGEIVRDHSWYGLGHWEKALYSTTFTHWLAHTQNDPYNCDFRDGYESSHIVAKQNKALYVCIILAQTIPIWEPIAEVLSEVLFAYCHTDCCCTSYFRMLLRFFIWQSSIHKTCEEKDTDIEVHFIRQCFKLYVIVKEILNYLRFGIIYIRDVTKYWGLKYTQ